MQLYGNADRLKKESAEETQNSRTLSPCKWFIRGLFYLMKWCTI